MKQRINNSKQHVNMNETYQHDIMYREGSDAPTIIFICLIMACIYIHMLCGEQIDYRRY